MYSVNGAFGKVRMADDCMPFSSSDLFGFTSAGWHECNSLYHINREEGGREFLLLFTVSGEGRLVLAGKPYALTAGCVAVLPPDTPLEYYTPKGGLWEFYWLHPGGDAACRLMKDIHSRCPAVFSSRDIRAYGEKIEELLFLHAGGRPGTPVRNSAAVSALLHQLLLEAEEEAAGARGETVSQRAIRHMEKHYEQPMSLRELAAALYLSPAYLIRRFRTETGYTPHEYLIRIRILQARRLLRFTDRPVSEVAAAVGFRDTSHFIRRYRAVEGITPGEERQVRRRE